MLVTRVLGDCPGCQGKRSFGNVMVTGDQLLRGCGRCKYRENYLLPDLHKKIVYLDQFFFSSAYRGGDLRFVEAAERIKTLSHKMLLVAPYSSIHEDETHQWRGLGERNKDDLMAFIKAASRGHEFKPAYEVESTQIQRAFRAFLEGGSPEFHIEARDVVRGDLHAWDNYFRLEVGRYMGDIELIRELKTRAVDQLVDLFPDWRTSASRFEEDVEAERNALPKSYFDAFSAMLRRMAAGDAMAVIDAPLIATMVEHLIFNQPEAMDFEEKLKNVQRYFQSPHFAAVPYAWIMARLYAALKDLVKNGAYTSREKAIGRLSGLHHDVKHIATYAPYCDAFVMDQPMAELVRHRGVRLEERYGVRVFSLNNWEEFMAWLQEIEEGITPDLEAALGAVYA